MFARTVTVLGALAADSDEDGQLFRLKTDSYSDR